MISAQGLMGPVILTAALVMSLVAASYLLVTAIAGPPVSIPAAAVALALLISVMLLVRWVLGGLSGEGRS